MTDTIDDFLEHHGIKGMHWGSRKSRSNAPAPMTRGQRSLARAQGRVARVASAQNESNARDKAILRARANVEKTGQRLSLAKAEYKVNKKTMDKHAAKAILAKHAAAHHLNVHDSQLLTAQEQKTARDQALADALDSVTARLNASSSSSGPRHSL